MSGLQVARVNQWPPSKVSRMESGHHNVTDLELLDYLVSCGIYPAQAGELMDLCRQAMRDLGYWLSPHGEWLPDSLKSLIYHESTAARTTTYDPLVVHGLLQTADYARAWIATERWRSPESVQECVDIRMRRQRILHLERPARFTFFVHEQALLLQVGGPKVMHEQMLQIVLLAALDHVTVRVVPWAAGEHSAFGGSFQLLEYAEHRPLVYLDNYATGLFLEDQEYVKPYRTLLRTIADVALDEGQSREVIAALANVYDRGSERNAGHRVEEEQL